MYTNTYIQSSIYTYTYRHEPGAKQKKKTWQVFCLINIFFHYKITGMDQGQSKKRRLGKHNDVSNFAAAREPFLGSQPHAREQENAAKIHRLQFQNKLK